MDTLGKRIKSRREELELDQVELARRVGISQPTLANLESGKNERTKYLQEIARELGVSTEWLSTGAGDKFGAIQAVAQPGYGAPKMSEILELLKLFDQASPRGRENILDLARAVAQVDNVRGSHAINS